MKLTKKQITEIIDDQGEIIGANNVPDNGADMHTRANKTTDYNASVGHQPFTYSTLALFGLNFLPFFENDDIQSNSEIVDNLAKYLYDHYLGMMGVYYKNPKKFQNDYRTKIKSGFNKEIAKHEYEMASDIIALIKPYLETELNQLSQELKNDVNENSFIEGKVLDKKTENDISPEKKNDNEVVDKNIEKIAGLINKKMKKKEVDKLKTLLEGK
jgi:hypothetical protein